MRSMLTTQLALRFTRALLAVFATIVGSPTPASAQKLQFNRDIRPILTEYCFACHGPDKNKRQANLRLDDPKSALDRAIAAGHPERSKLIERINATDGRIMPPAATKHTLTAAQKQLLVRWIREGAEYQPHWAYIAPKRPEVPQPAEGRMQEAVGRNAIDAFVLARLAARGIKPSPEADRRTLIRRVYLDLIGIPPTPQAVEQFLNDRSANAYEKVVDQLLASPHYGERMAVPWLDLARYADTVGYHGDQNMNAWAYRDYVIDSFNKNKPFDQFTREQLAGDLLLNASTESRVATCFNRLNMVTREGGAQPKEYMAKYAADRVRTVSMTWLGSTMGCCECHNHKYDPFTAKDFYSMAAFFSDLKQWGVYQDYDYTPNPDLRGWSNDHPFPPEITVQSPYLIARIAKDQAKARTTAVDGSTTLAGDPKARSAFEEWRKKAREFLAAHPDGWEAPSETEIVRTDNKPAGDKQLFARQQDGSLLITSAAPPEVAAVFSPKSPWATTIRIETLPNEANGGTIARPGSGRTLGPLFTLQPAGGAAIPLRARYARANIHEPRYSNGFDLIGVLSGWRIPADRMKEPLESTWILETPRRLMPGDRIQVTFKGVRVGQVKVSVSPFGPSNPDTPDVSAGLADALESDGPANPAAMEAYLRGTAWNADAYKKIEAIDLDIAECRQGQTPVMVVEAIKQPVVTRILPRGNWQDERGEVVQPAVPEFLPHPVGSGARLTRLDLANWIVSPENPLTARVFVNRLWKQFFGAGICESVEDFGAQGEAPSNPELLDWLACEFMSPTTQRPNDPTTNRSAWDIKHIVKLIVMSSTYRQSSRIRPEVKKVDPGNRLLAYQNPRRLEAEVVRDNALAISGLLNEDMGGPPCKPYQPAGYYANLQFPDREYQPDLNDRQWRRGVYSHWQRTFLQPMLANFDAPAREDTCPVRTVANTPQQALTLLNDPTFVEASRAFAARVMSLPAASDAERIAKAYEIALARPPKPAEADSMLGFLKTMRHEYGERKDDSKMLETVGIAPVPAGSEPVELAAWTAVCHVILNLHETITRY